MPTVITIETITGIAPFDIYISNSQSTPAIYIATISTAPYTFNVPTILENLEEYAVKIVDSNGCTIYDNLNFLPPTPINYLVEQCCSLTPYWVLPNGDLTDLSTAVPTGDCLDFDTLIRSLRDELRICYCDTLSDACITNYYTYETQPCGRKTIKYDAGGGLYYWFVQNSDYTFSVYTIEESIIPGSYNIIKDINCCSETYMSGYTNSDSFSSDCGSFTGNGVFDWYNRTILATGLGEDYLFYPYYDSETSQCLVSGNGNTEIVTITDNYSVLNKVIKSDEGICYDVKSIVTSASTITWTPPTKYVDCDTCNQTTSFIFVWRILESGGTLTLPYVPPGVYSGVIDWGDGNVSVNSYANRAHTYDDGGDYTVTITGVLQGWRFNGSFSSSKIIEILQWGEFKDGSYGKTFLGCVNLTLTNVVDTPKYLSGNIDRFFEDCTSITTINNLNSWDVSNVNSFVNAFKGLINFDQNIGGWDMSNSTDLSSMFYDCQLFNNGNDSSINNWVVSGVTTMNYLFYNNQQFNQPIGNWDVSSVGDMTGMFSDSQFNQPIGDWDVSSVTNMTQMFAITPFNQPLSGWNVSNVTDMPGMFYDSSFNQNIGDWNVSSLLSAPYMLNNTPMSITNYDNLLVGWASLGSSLQPSVELGVNGLTYIVSNSGPSRTYLTDTKLWNIVGDTGI